MAKDRGKLLLRMLVERCTLQHTLPPGWKEHGSPLTLDRRGLPVWRHVAAAWQAQKGLIGWRLAHPAPSAPAGLACHLAALPATYQQQVTHLQQQCMVNWCVAQKQLCVQGISS